MQISRGCCDFLKVHLVGGNDPSGNQHSPVWEKQFPGWYCICNYD